MCSPTFWRNNLEKKPEQNEYRFAAVYEDKKDNAEIMAVGDLRPPDTGIFEEDMICEIKQLKKRKVKILQLSSEYQIIKSE